MNLARCAYPNCGLTRLSTIHWTDDPNAEIAHGSHEYRAAPPPLDGLREALVDLVEFTEARVKDTCTPLSGCALANAKRLLALRDEGETT